MLLYLTVKTVRRRFILYFTLWAIMFNKCDFEERWSLSFFFSIRNNKGTLNCVRRYFCLQNTDFSFSKPKI